MRHRHHGPLEHVQLTFRVRAPIYVARQHMRHRTWAFNEISRRYTSGRPEFYMADDYVGEWPQRVRGTFEEAARMYEKMAEELRPERARDILPMATMTEYMATVDLRNFLHFHELRDSTHAQWEIREAAKAMFGLVFHPDNRLQWVYEAYMLYGMRGEEGLMAYMLRGLWGVLTDEQKSGALAAVRGLHRLVGAEGMIERTERALLNSIEGKHRG